MRLIAKAGLSVLIAPLLAFLVALPGGAEERSISLSVHLGYRDIVRPGQWMPVTVDATNNGQDFAGTLEVEAQDLAGGFGKGPAPVPALGIAATRSTAVFQLPVTLPAGATKHFRTYLLTDNPGATVAARFTRDGRTVTSQTVTPTNTTSMLVGVLSDQANAFDDFGAVRLTSNSPTLQVAHLQREELADSGILLRAFDLLAIDDLATDGLTAAQRNALADYVANGGNLLLGTGASWRKTLAGVPAALVPLRIDGTASLVRTPALPGAGRLEIATGGSSSGDAWLSDASRPLLLEMAVGQGLVTLATFDWAQEPIASWSGTRSLLRQVAIRTLLRGTNAAATGFGVGGMGAGVVFSQKVVTTYGSQGSLTQRSNMLLPALGNVPALDLPPLRVTGLLVLLYILIIGPLNFLVLRLVGRLELAWLTVPVLAIIFAGGAYGIGLGTKGRAVQSNQISVVHVIPGWKSAYRETYTGIFTPTRGDFTVRLADRSLIAPIVTYGPSGPITGSVRIRPDQGSVDLLGVTAFTLRGFATESMVSFSGLSASVRLVEGKLSGQLENHSSIRFRDAVVIAGDNFQSLGPLAPGASASISLDPSTSSTFPGPPIFTRIYSPIPQAGQAAQRETIQRQQILQMVLGYSGPATRIAPTVIAWTTEPLEAITVNGHSPKAHAQNAVVLPLSIDEFAAGTLPAGLITPRLIDTTGEVTVNPGGIFVRDGSATFEFRLPGVAARLSQAGIRSSSSPYGAKGVLAAPGSPVSTIFESEVWDWSRSAWRSISLKDNDTAALPDTAINAATGTIRLRVHSVSASVFQLGNLSLTGTLQ